jgi:hypothetical protein
MKRSIVQALPKIAFAVTLALGVATAAVAASAQPAQAGVFVAAGFGGGYAPGYHWHRWHDGAGWHRRWVRWGWAPPVAVAPAYFAPRFYPEHPGPYGYPHHWYRHPYPGDWR